jgi:glutamyl-tRNA synthetase
MNESLSGPSKQEIIGRLAPSPTGAQHVGNARTYLIAWLSARSRGGRVVLRMEDIDSPRVKAGAMEQACADLRWLGLDWDGEPLIQSQRLDVYRAALASLSRQELVYPCTCTRSDVERAASAPHLDQEGPVYPGTCAARQAGDGDFLTDRLFCWRFRLPADAASFHDEFRGQVSVDLHRLGGDFVLWKAPRAAGEPTSPAYQLAVVVDDAAQGVTEVLRGDDLIPSTPRQMLLYHALGLQAPTFAHVPLVVGPDGRRLAKRHGDTRLAALRAAGVAPEALIGLVAWSCGWLDRIEPCTVEDLLPRFSLQSVPPRPYVLTLELLAEIGYRP